MNRSLFRALPFGRRHPPGSEADPEQELIRALGRIDESLAVLRKQVGTKPDRLVALRQPGYRSALASIKGDHSTRLTRDRLGTLWQAARNVAAVPGAAAEIGSYRGGSAKFIAAAFRALLGHEVPVEVIDTFEGHPAEKLSEQDAATHRDPTRFTDTSYEHVVDYLAEFEQVTVHKGEFSQVAPSLPEQSVPVRPRRRRPVRARGRLSPLLLTPPRAGRRDRPRRPRVAELPGHRARGRGVPRLHRRIPELGVPQAAGAGQERLRPRRRPRPGAEPRRRRAGDDHRYLAPTLTLPAHRAWRRFGRGLPAAGLLLLGFAVLFPTWIVLPGDDEGLLTTISPTVFQSKHLLQYPFWDPLVGFGIPQPASQSLIYHPFVLLIQVASLAFSIGLLYQVQLWIALFAVWALCRRLGLRPWIAFLCTFSFALSTATIQFLNDFWPEIMVLWTLSPVLLLLLIKLLDSDRRSSRALYGVASGLCAAFMILDGHTGTAPVFAVAFGAFLLGSPRRLREVWPWLVLALFVAAAAAGTRVFDIELENARTAGHYQQVYPINFPHLLLYPLHQNHYGLRLIGLGGIFVLLALVGLVWRKVTHPYADAIRIATAVAFLAWFLPVSWLPALSGNWYFGKPFTLFAILLAGLTLERLWQSFPRFRPLLLIVAGLQVAALVAGFLPQYRSDFRRALDHLHGRKVLSLENTFENQPLYAYFEQRPDHRSTRVYMAPLARDRLWRSLTDYQAATWMFHGLRLVNGHFRGVDVSEFQQTVEGLHGEIRGERSLWEGTTDNLQTAATVFEVLNVGYVLATPGERVASSLVLLRRFHLPPPLDAKLAATDVEVYRNPEAWPDAVVLAPKANQIDRLRPRAGCDIPGLLCDDLSPIVPLRQKGAVVGQEWHGTSLHVRLAPRSQPAVLMVSQLYRPGWRAHLSNGRTVSGHRLFGAVTGFDLPPGTRTAVIEFHPTARIAFATLSWVTLLLGLVFLGAAAIRGAVAGTHRVEPDRTARAGRHAASV